MFESPRDVVVGRYYMVPCVVAGYTVHGKEFPWPVIGPQHTDPDIGNHNTHYHNDVRFLSDYVLKRFFPFYAFLCPPTEEVAPYAITHILTVPPERPVTMVRKQCHRQMPEFPLYRWSPKLEGLYAKAMVDPARPICPHKGMPLVCQPDSEGVVVCSGHGLAWDLNTGRLVPRAKKD